jgi:deazaflavin-dependent oxidoreductase (nitroreductase family)
MSEKTGIEEANKEKFIYLTTTGRKTGRSYTKELWFAVASGKIFLSHEGGYTDWMKNIARNPRVSARIGSRNIEADGRILGEKGEPREMGKKSLYEKYYGPASKEVIDDWFELSTVVELTPIESSSGKVHS